MKRDFQSSNLATGDTESVVHKTISIPLVQASHVTDVSILWYYRNDQKSTQLLFLTLFRLLPLILTHSNTFLYSVFMEECHQFAYI